MVQARLQREVSALVTVFRPEQYASRIKLLEVRKVGMVNASVAPGVARRVHAGQVSRSGEPLIEHVERVARGVPAEARALAYLHDVLERADGAVAELRELEMSDDEWRVLALLTRRPDESYRAYVMRIARADGSLAGLPARSNRRISTTICASAGFGAGLRTTPGPGDR